MGDRTAQLAVVHERITRLESQLQDRTVGAEHLATLEVRAGRLGRAQKQLTARQARIATLETQVQQLQQIAEQAHELITQLEHHAGELATARLRIAEVERGLQSLEVAQTQPGLLVRFFRRE